jgi:hypothetical protein
MFRSATVKSEPALTPPPEDAEVLTRKLSIKSDDLCAQQSPTAASPSLSPASFLSPSSLFAQDLPSSPKRTLFKKAFSDDNTIRRMKSLSIIAESRVSFAYKRFNIAIKSPIIESDPEPVNIQWAAFSYPRKLGSLRVVNLELDLEPDSDDTKPAPPVPQNSSLHVTTDALPTLPTQSLLSVQTTPSPTLPIQRALSKPIPARQKSLANGIVCVEYDPISKSARDFQSKNKSLFRIFKRSTRRRG